MSTYLDDIAEARHTIEVVANRLARLAQAFGTTGNVQMEETLYDMRLELDTQSERIGKAVSDELTASLKVAQNGSRAMLSAVLAGVIMGKDTKTT